MLDRPFPATGVKIEERRTTILRIVDGKTRDEWPAFDLLRVVRQCASQLEWPVAELLAAVVAFGAVYHSKGAIS